MDEALKNALVAVKDDSNIAINVKMGKILKLLQDHGMVYEQVLVPSLLAIDPDNRSGLMRNSFDVRSKGVLALKMGFQVSKVSEAFCFEVSGKKATKDQQVDKMRTLVESSDRRLAPLNGTERFLSVSCSHITQFLKAVACGQCFTSNEELLKHACSSHSLSLGSLEAHYQDDQFAQMIKAGWPWKCIKAEVEEICPWLPNLLQAAPNSSNAIGKQTTEMEVALNLAYTYKATGSMEEACEACKACTTLGYVEAISNWVRLYGGGDGFPLVELLVSIQKLFNSSLHLGEEFMCSVAYPTFKSKESMYPFVRCALLACNLSSPRAQDGVAKLLVRGDVERLKSNANQQNVDLSEKLLKLAFQQHQGALANKKDTQMVKTFARLLIRTALWLFKKEGKGRESKVFGTLEAINETFKDELQGGASQAIDSQPSQASGGDTQDKVLSLEDSNDAVTIAKQQYNWLVVGNNFLKKDSTAIYRFKKMTAEHGIFVVQDIWGGESDAQVLHKDLKLFRPTDKAIPKQVPQDLVKQLQLSTSQQWQDEITKAQVQVALFNNYLNEGVVDMKALVFMDDQKVYAGKQIKKTPALKIFPFGVVQKLAAEQMKKAKVVVTNLKDKTAYQVQQPKFDLKKASGAIAPFFWIAPTTDPDLANLVLSEVKVQDGNLSLSIPCFKNKGQIEAGAQLMYEKEKDESKDDGNTEEQPKKKAKRS